MATDRDPQNIARCRGILNALGGPLPDPQPTDEEIARGMDELYRELCRIGGLPLPAAERAPTEEK